MKSLTPLLLTVFLAAPLLAQDAKPLGYQDTPLIPGTQWHVHDGLRPQPKVMCATAIVIANGRGPTTSWA